MPSVAKHMGILGDSGNDKRVHDFDVLWIRDKCCLPRLCSG